MRHRQQGFGAIVAIVILVILAALAAAIVSLGSTQAHTQAQDALATRAWQAARTGNEWGLYRAMKDLDWPAAAVKCTTTAFGSPIHETLDLTAATGLRVRVSCESQEYNEGESTPGTAQKVRIYRITSVACNAAACPAGDASSPGYVERTRVVVAAN